MVGTPRLDTPLGHRSPLGQVIQLLEYEFHGDAAAETPVRRRRAKAVVKIDEPSDDAAGKAAGDSSAQPAVKRNVRRPRRKKGRPKPKSCSRFTNNPYFEHCP